MFSFLLPLCIGSSIGVVIGAWMVCANIRSRE